MSAQLSCKFQSRLSVVSGKTRCLRVQTWRRRKFRWILKRLFRHLSFSFRLKNALNNTLINDFSQTRTNCAGWRVLQRGRGKEVHPKHSYDWHPDIASEKSPRYTGHSEAQISPDFRYWVWLWNLRQCFRGARPYVGWSRYLKSYAGCSFWEESRRGRYSLRYGTRIRI